jgi:pimeloyl-ACP methyl ester carboxylesterase
MRAETRQRLRLLGGTELSFITAGEAANPAMLLLHGSPSSVRMFRKIIPELSQAAYVIAPDLPGFGESDVLPSPSFPASVKRSRHCWTGSRSGRDTSIYTITALRWVCTSPCRLRNECWASSFRTPTLIEPG